MKRVGDLQILGVVKVRSRGGRCKSYELKQNVNLSESCNIV